MPSTHRPSTASTWLIAAALAVGACGGTAASAAPSVAAVPSATAAPTTPTPTVAPPSPTPTASPSPTARASLATTGRIEVAEKGFAVTLPDGWVRIDLSADDLEALITAAGQVTPELARSYSAQVTRLVAAGLVVFAFGPGGEANLNILALPSMGLSLDLLEQLNRSQIDQLADGDVKVERVKLPAGEALHFTYRVKAEGQGSPSIDQFMLLAGDQQLVVTLTSGTAAQAKAISTSIDLLD